MKMTILSWNVNGIRAAVKNGFSTWLKSCGADIVGLQEIKIDDLKRAKEVFDFAGYEEFWCPAKRPGYSGTAILVKTGLKVKATTTGLGIEDFDHEGRVQTLEMDKFWLVNTYFPNAQPGLVRLHFKERFNSAILNYIKKLEATKPVILCGDLNVAHQEIDIARPKANEGSPGFSFQERIWADKFMASGLVDTFRELHPKKVQYSWWSYRANARTNNVGWRIDYFLVSAKLRKHVEKAFILDQIKGSDHCPIGIELKF